MNIPQGIIDKAFEVAAFKWAAAENAEPYAVTFSEKPEDSDWLSAMLYSSPGQLNSKNFYILVEFKQLEKLFEAGNLFPIVYTYEFYKKSFFLAGRSPDVIKEDKKIYYPFGHHVIFHMDYTHFILEDYCHQREIKLDEEIYPTLKKYALYMKTVRLF